MKVSGILPIISLIAVFAAFSTNANAENCQVTVTTGECPDACLTKAKLLAEKEGAGAVLEKLHAKATDLGECAPCAPESIKIVCQ